MSDQGARVAGGTGHPFSCPGTRELLEESRISAVTSMGLELTLVMMQIVSSVLPPRKRMTCVQVLRCEGRGCEEREEQ